MNVCEHALTNVVRCMNVCLATLVACDLIFWRCTPAFPLIILDPRAANYGKVKLKVGTQCSGWYSARLVQHARLVQRPGAAVGAARAPPLNNDRGAH